jgi:hypothetical protein
MLRGRSAVAAPFFKHRIAEAVLDSGSSHPPRIARQGTSQSIVLNRFAAALTLESGPDGMISMTHAQHF